MQKIDNQATVSHTAHVNVDKLYMATGARIGHNVQIEAPEIILSRGAIIDDGTIIKSTGKVYLGDYSFIGANSIIIIHDLCIQDYSKIQRNAFMNGNGNCYIGYNVWIGSNCILNCEEQLYIGNGVGIGTYSSVWTHAHHGELLEGCTLNKTAPVTIQDDAWILGCYNVISPGVTLGKKSLIMTGSIVTKDVPDFGVVAGGPARAIPSLHIYSQISIDRKFEMMKQFVREFIHTLDCDNITEKESGWEITTNGRTSTIVFFEHADKLQGCGFDIAIVQLGISSNTHYSGSVFDIATKKYFKTSSVMEVALIQFLLYEKARFIPL